MILVWIYPFGFFFEAVLVGNEDETFGTLGAWERKGDPNLWSWRLEASLLCWRLFPSHQAKKILNKSLGDGGISEWQLVCSCEVGPLTRFSWGHKHPFLVTHHTLSPLFPLAFSVYVPGPLRTYTRFGQNFYQKLHPCRQSSASNLRHQKEKNKLSKN